MSNARIKITRNNEYFGMGRGLKVFIDNTHVGDAGWNETSEFSVTPGQHVVYVEMDWCQSAPATVNLTDGDTSEFEVTVPAGQLAQTVAMTFKRKRFFGLKKR
jgi:hypothetical protein